MEAKWIREDHGFGIRQKALRGESQERFKHETGLNAVKGADRQDGNQSMQVVRSLAAAKLDKKFLAVQTL